MKKSTILYIAAAAVLSSCNLLEEDVRTSLTEGYGTEKLLEMEVRGITKGLDNSLMYTGEVHNLIYAGSGLTHQNPNGSSTTNLSNADYYGIKQFTSYSSSSHNYSFFRYNYICVDRCNSLIAGLATSPVDSAYRKEIEAEAKFLRAFLYFHIVRCWGDVPMPLVQTQQNNTSNPRTKYDSVYCRIVEDLKFAELYMRTPERVEEVTPGEGRPSRYAATAYLSSVYLQIGSLLAHPDDNFWNPSKPDRVPDFSGIGINSAEDAFRLSLDKARSLIPVGHGGKGEGPYRLATSFPDLFKWTKGYVTEDGCDCWSLPERIFVLNITTQASTAYIAKRTLPNFVAGSSNYTQYDSNNGNWRPDRWLFQTWCEKYPGTKGSGKYSDIYATSSDPRLDATFYHTKVATQSDHKEGYIYTYPSASAITPGHANSMPYFRKYFSSDFNCNAGCADYYFMRLTEMYLNAAECSAWLGDEAGVRKYVKPLHDRARRGKAGAVEPDWSARTWGSTEELVTDIFWERVFEMIGEGHDWYDTHRFGANWIVNNISKPKNAFLNMKEQNSDGYKSASYGTYKTYYYGTDSLIYCENASNVRAGLLLEFPSSEVINNPMISSTRNDYNY